MSIQMKRYLLSIIGIMILHSVQAQVIDRSHQPAAGPAPVLTLKDPVISRLPNGITLLVVEDHRFPKVSAALSIDAGPVTEGPKAGMMALMGGMLGEGTRTMPKAVFDEAIEKLGAEVSLNSSGGSASALTRYFKSSFILMGQALKDPAFAQASFDKLKSQAITNFKSQSKSSPAIASRLVHALSYGKNHPEGEFETEESLNSITLQDVKNAYHTYITPSRAYLTIIGDIKPADAEVLAKQVFGTWKGALLKLPVLDLVANPAKTEIDMINMPDAVQAEISMINLVDLKKNDPDYFPALLANYILGGGAESRLFMNLREKHGYTYGSYSGLGSGRFQTLFQAEASVRNAKADSAVREMMSEVRRIRAEKVSDEELKNAKALYNGSFALGLEDPARTATFASNILINDLPADFYKTYLQRVNAVTADDIQRVAIKYMNYDNTRIVIVGNTAEIPDNFKKSGFNVKLYDAYANPVTQTSASALPSSVKPSDIIKDYIQATGGMEALKKLNSYTQTLTMSMQGMSLNVVSKKMAPNKELMTVSMGGNTMMKTLFDGEKGYQQQMGAKKDLTAEEIASKKVFTSLTEQVDFLNNPAFKLVLKGIEKINGSDAYQVLITDPAGKTSVHYYDVKSKFLVKIETTTTTNNTPVKQTVELSDYRKVGNLLFPYKQTITVAAGAATQSFDMLVSDIKLNTGVAETDFK